MGEEKEQLEVLYKKGFSAGVSKVIKALDKIKDPCDYCFSDNCIYCKNQKVYEKKIKQRIKYFQAILNDVDGGN